MGPSIRAATGAVTQRCHVLQTSYTAVFPIQGPYYQFTTRAQSRVLVCSCPPDSLLLGNGAVGEQLAGLAGSGAEPAEAGHRQNVHSVAALSPGVSKVPLCSESSWNEEEPRGEEGAVMSLMFRGADGQRQHGDERGRRGGGGPRGGQREQGAHALHPVAARAGQAAGAERRRERDWEISSVHQWTNAVVQCVLYLFAVSWAMSCWSLLFWTQVPFSSSAVLPHFCVMPSFPVGVPWIFLFLFESLINLLCNFRWASFSCKFRHLA